MENIKRKFFVTIFGTGTPQGRLFDIFLLCAIGISFLMIIAESVSPPNSVYSRFFYYSEWVFTILFSLEYMLRIVISPSPRRYIFSFWGIIDLLSVIPTYFSIFIPGAQYLATIRILRLLRIFGILGLSRFLGEIEILIASLQRSLYRILIFFGFVVTLATVLGSIMFVVEGGKSGFIDIPNSVYWAIVTITTVGFGDITPQTPLGKFIASIIMLLGYSIIAVPTGIISAEIVALKAKKPGRACPHCLEPYHDSGAKYCYRCGEKL